MNLTTQASFMRSFLVGDITPDEMTAQQLAIVLDEQSILTRLCTRLDVLGNQMHKTREIAADLVIDTERAVLSEASHALGQAHGLALLRLCRIERNL